MLLTRVALFLLVLTSSAAADSNGEEPSKYVSIVAQFGCECALGEKGIDDI